MPSLDCLYWTNQLSSILFILLSLLLGLEAPETSLGHRGVVPQAAVVLPNRHCDFRSASLDEFLALIDFRNVHQQYILDLGRFFGYVMDSRFGATLGLHWAHSVRGQWLSPRVDAKLRIDASRVFWWSHLRCSVASRTSVPARPSSLLDSNYCYLYCLLAIERVFNWYV